MEPAGLVQMGSAPYMQMGMGENVVEVISIPDNTVGLVIGRGGSEIQNIQAQSQCRVQMSPDGESTTPGYRSCTLQGSKISVERAKQLITEVINRANQRQQQGTPGGGSGGMMNQSFGNDSRHITVEVLIPAAKCGLVIGKQGDTIKQLQEQAGCKMLMIQDSQEVTGQPKPLRITGDPDKVELAKRLISDLLSSRDDQSGGALVAHRPHHAEAATAKGEVVVPRTSVGMIIGKGGETIKRLAVETGTKIQFKPDDDPNSPDRCAVIMGTRDQIYKATELITELVHKSCNGGGPAGGGGPTATEVFYMHVPSNKTGLVIGKGGETIKQINNESGAHCELSRDPPPNSQEKVFIVKGTPYQIHHAQHIIRIKVGDLAPGTPVPPFNGAMNGGFNAQQQFGQPIQQNQWSGGYNQGDPAGGWAGQPQQAFYPTAAAQPGYAAAQFQQPTAQQFPAAAVAAQPAAAQNPGINPQTGQPDYSAQWAEYYRSMGMHDQAALIENQMKQNQAAAGVRTGTTPSATPATASSTPGQGTQYAGYTGAQQQSFPQTGQFSAQTPQY